ncbi:toll/interleukin-1 receptor (TIR) domain-containing protein [Artemisia annua]|uniref:Toll/interleukin-1 receptor (TIR) domain-containing protein n=1 Tax=Artemisia annua TaxID=35608 RepID=A0A2U1MZV2_ARTAN|nr:toll/interleukin-1 receptor (TIR) domain-containing protein [Artemisia annua]
MEPTSTTSVQKSFKYDVFLSFRGEDTREDTRNTFVGHLYKALVQRGIQTYKDDKKIEKGKTIDKQLIKSIEESRFFIIVFSKDYASSRWCLNELVKIMECQKTSDERIAYPVFYHVEPREIRNQSGAVGEAFKKHENDEDATKWRDALNDAGKLAGSELKGDESILIEEIVDIIFKKICSSNSSVDENLVGMVTRREAVLSSLELDADDVRMIGIWGMGGGGKTTLAKVVFDRIFIHFDGKAFVENVKDVSKSSLGLKQLQQQILCSVLSNKDINVNSVHEGTNMMKNLLRGRKVLIVLDDVDDIEQLEVLAGKHDWFKSGSRVIITTRDQQVLVAHQVKFINDISLLSPAEAICLLSKYAFNRDIPVVGYEELSQEVVQYADGLPLTIKVLGSLLCGQNVPYWKETLARLKKIPLKATMKKLELSYDGLENDHKEMFLDVACFLKGRKEEDAVIVLESCGFFPKVGLEVLKQRSLITISGGELGMHDHIEEMGKNIVRRENPNKPEMHSRLWIKEEIEDILANGSGTQATTQCIKLFAPGGLNYEILMKGLANMKELRFLYVVSPFVSFEEVRKWKFDEDSLHLPNALRFLRWDYYPFSSLPKTFQPNNLVGLEMNFSRMVKLWKDGEEKPFLKLRFLKFTISPHLRTLDLSVAPNLETLFLEDCYNLVEVHFQKVRKWKFDEDSLHLPNALRFLRWSWYPFSSLPKTFQPNHLVGLEIHFAKMVKLWKDGEEKPFLKLRFLKLTNSHVVRTLDLSVAPNLETLILDQCFDLEEVHFQVTPNLKELSINYCYRLEELQMPAESPKLRSLDLRDLKKLRVTPNLETLRVTDCADLVELQVPAECPKLINLNLSNCVKVAELPEEIGRLECLKELDITGTGLSRLPESIFGVKGLRIVGSRQLLEHQKQKSPVPWSSDDFEHLQRPKEEYKVYFIESDLRKSIFRQNLKSETRDAAILIFPCGMTGYKGDFICGLQFFGLHLKGTPDATKGLDQLECPEQLSLWSTYIKNLSDNICMMKHLKYIEIKSCCLLEKLPENIDK